MWRLGQRDLGYVERGVEIGWGGCGLQTCFLWVWCGSGPLGRRSRCQRRFCEVFVLMLKRNVFADRFLFLVADYPPLLQISDFPRIPQKVRIFTFHQALVCPRNDREFSLWSECGEDGRFTCPNVVKIGRFTSHFNVPLPEAG